MILSFNDISEVLNAIISSTAVILSPTNKLFLHEIPPFTTLKAPVESDVAS